MIRHKWIVGLRNKLSELAMECDSAAAIEGAKMTSAEREHIKNKLKEVVNYIDERVFK